MSITSGPRNDPRALVQPSYRRCGAGNHEVNRDEPKLGDRRRDRRGETKGRSRFRRRIGVRRFRRPIGVRRFQPSGFLTKEGDVCN